MTIASRGRKPRHITSPGIKGLHLPALELVWAISRHSCACPLVANPRLKLIKTNTHLPSWLRKFLLEGAFSAISSAYLRAYSFGVWRPKNRRR